MRLKKGIFFILFAFSINTHAAPQVTSPVVPSMVHVYDEYGNTYVDLVPTDCSGKRFYISTNHPKYNVILSILISAQVANKEVIGRFDGCNAINQGHLIGVYLK